MPTPDRPRKKYDKSALRKICGCRPRLWGRCPHPWHFAWMWKGNAYRFSLEREVGHALATRTDALTEAERLRRLIRAGQFRVAPAPPTTPTTPTALTLEDFGQKFVERYSQVTRHKRT